MTKKSVYKVSKIQEFSEIQELFTNTHRCFPFRAAKSVHIKLLIFVYYFYKVQLMTPPQ